MREYERLNILVKNSKYNTSYLFIYATKHMDTFIVSLETSFVNKANDYNKIT